MNVSSRDYQPTHAFNRINIAETSIITILTKPLSRNNWANRINVMVVKTVQRLGKSAVNKSPPFTQNPSIL